MILFPFFQNNVESVVLDSIHSIRHLFDKYLNMASALDLTHSYAPALIRYFNSF